MLGLLGMEEGEEEEGVKSEKRGARREGGEGQVVFLFCLTGGGQACSRQG